jgi:hypothetical protein
MNATKIPRSKKPIKELHMEIISICVFAGEKSPYPSVTNVTAE